MGTRTKSRFIRLFAICAIGLLPQASRGEFSADRPAAILTFPLVSVSSSAGIDTSIQLGNADTANPVDVSCFLQDMTRHCSAASQLACSDAVPCPAGDVCVPQNFVPVGRFTLRLTAGQPLEWLVSAGRSSLPGSESTAAIPAVPTDPFTGVLRCIVSGRPSDANVLVGRATTRRHDLAAGTVDDTAYNAVGASTTDTSENGDDQLILGGPGAEFAACPATLIFDHFFDLAIDPVSHAQQVTTQLTIVPCTADLFRAPATVGATAVQALVFNQFEDRFATSFVVTSQYSRTLSLIDSSTPTRSIFSAGVAGTLSGQTQLQGITGGIMAIGMEEHQDLADPTRESSAAFNIHSQGERANADVILTKIKCPSAPAPGCRTSRIGALIMDDGEDGSSRRVVWKWRRGGAIDDTEFADPTTETDDALCIYAGATGALVDQLTIPASSHWRRGRRGFTYRNLSAVEDGVRSLVLESGQAGDADVVLKARGAYVPPVSLHDPLPPPIVAQLINDSNGLCLGTTFSGDGIDSNGQGNFAGRYRQ